MSTNLIIPIIENIARHFFRKKAVFKTLQQKISIKYEIYITIIYRQLNINKIDKEVISHCINTLAIFSKNL